mgnify:CR=1 FL=1
MIERNEMVETADIIENGTIEGPGKILANAREKKGFTQQQVANKLNFRLTLVSNIEADIYDKSLPETFNRGYLRSYAKLVSTEAAEVLARYDCLNNEKNQCAEMQSFSKITEKEAENNRLKWVSYLIIALLVASTMMWWLQDSTEDKDILVTEPDISALTPENIIETVNETATEAVEENLISPVEISTSTEENTNLTEQVASETSVNVNLLDDATLKQKNLTTAKAIFTFSGDCWVNIYDATGERIAWGVKKSGYVMTIEGQPPLKVTIGKPELAEINFNGEVIDMSQFNLGNIAKFTLPITP